ncbi:hypothetical protein Lalb_Chr17g0338421 [Lupinus albus]|uniref:Uncharacterized protein n=1 Tax=Lupinus albus TaxID=3870 RepID=A0A6A4P1D1_LUPAL|nr:hypothetical protein Lalb_Chr17g0338421 [Lupinus albus]
MHMMYIFYLEGIVGYRTTEVIHILCGSDLSWWCCMVKLGDNFRHGWLSIVCFYPWWLSMEITFSVDD